MATEKTGVFKQLFHSVKATDGFNKAAVAQRHLCAFACRPAEQHTVGPDYGLFPIGGERDKPDVADVHI
jgi:hypothetical protein